MTAGAPGTSILTLASGRRVEAPPALRLIQWRPPLYRLEEAWSYYWVGDDGRSRLLRVSEGMVTDLASVPKLLWLFIAPTDLEAAAIPHDLLYGHGGVLPPGMFAIDGEPCPDPWSRLDTDRLFARMMREAGVERWRRRAAYRAVRLFGRFSWKAPTPV